MYEVVLSPGAREFFAAADIPLAKKLRRCFEYLETNPKSGPNIKSLRGEFAGYRRYRIGDWRVVYSVHEPKRRVFVADIAHRRDVYE